MLVERGLQAMNVELVSEAYAIAANYLRRSGAIPDTLVTNEHLLEIIIKLIQHGEFNKIRLANKAIMKFETQPGAARLPDQQSQNIDQPEGAMEAAIDRIMQTYDLLANRTAAASEEARAKVTNYLNTLMEAGEKDTHRLTVCGLTYLRQLDGSVDPVKAGYTGL